ncbi:hypothetical protein NC652_022970 [Populus alba x Populus x berolinensis]|nr:hypothetical protein NC652_022970 [Populus alba x Populus x berolinensis]
MVCPLPQLLLPLVIAPGELNRLGGVRPTNLEDIFGSLDPSILPQMQGLSLDAAVAQLQPPTGMQMRQNINQQLRSSYPTSFSSSPVRRSPSFGVDHSGGAAAAVLSSRSAAFAKRSQSFVERSALNRHTGFSSPSSSANGEELNKLRKSASFGFRSNGSSFATAAASVPATVDEQDVSWVQSLVKDTPAKSGPLGFEEQQQCHLNIGGSETLPAWVEQLYMEQKPLVA